MYVQGAFQSGGLLTLMCTLMYCYVYVPVSVNVHGMLCVYSDALGSVRREPPPVPDLASRGVEWTPLSGEERQRMSIASDEKQQRFESEVPAGSEVGMVAKPGFPD